MKFYINGTDPHKKTLYTEYLIRTVENRPYFERPVDDKQ